MTTRKRMCEIKGLSEAKVDKIKECAAKLMVRVEEHLRLLAKVLFIEYKVRKFPRFFFMISYIRFKAHQHFSKNFKLKARSSEGLIMMRS